VADLLEFLMGNKKAGRFMEFMLVYCLWHIF